IIVRIAIVTGTKARGVDLEERQRITVGEEAAVGQFIQVVRVGVVEVRQEPTGELLSQGEADSVVVGNGSTLNLRDRSVVRHGRAGLRYSRHKRLGTSC